MHTEAIYIEFVVIELLRENGTEALVRAYVVDSITEMKKVKVPEEIRREFSASAKWPEKRYHGEIEILLGIEESSIHPECIENIGNLGIFKSPLGNTTILAGRHKNIFPVHLELSETCSLMKGEIHLSDIRLGERTSIRELNWGNGTARIAPAEKHKPKATKVGVPLTCVEDKSSQVPETGSSVNRQTWLQKVKVVIKNYGT